MQTITPYLWFDNQAEEAVNFYASVFKNAKVHNITRAGDAGPVISASFELNGQNFFALNGGPQFKFNEAVSFLVSCKNQDEVDELWSKLTADGGSEGNCGWLKDKYGLSWQIIPDRLGELLGDKDPEKAGRVGQAMLKMHKIVIKDLEQAYAG